LNQSTDLYEKDLFTAFSDSANSVNNLNTYQEILKLFGVEDIQEAFNAENTNSIDYARDFTNLLGVNPVNLSGRIDAENFAQILRDLSTRRDLAGIVDRFLYPQAVDKIINELEEGDFTIKDVITLIKGEKLNEMIAYPHLIDDSGEIDLNVFAKFLEDRGYVIDLKSDKSKVSVSASALAVLLVVILSERLRNRNSSSRVRKNAIKLAAAPVSPAVTVPPLPPNSNVLPQWSSKNRPAKPPSW